MAMEKSCNEGLNAKRPASGALQGAGDRARTGDIQLGRLTLYQLSYTRAFSECTKRCVRDDVR